MARRNAALAKHYQEKIMFEATINGMLTTFFTPFIRLAGTAHQCVDYFGALAGF